MKTRYLVLLAISAYLIFFLFMFPAQPVASLINENTQAKLSGVSGSIWRGHARQISIDGIVLTDNHWDMNIWKLMIGQASMDISARFEDEPVSGEVGAYINGRLFANLLRGRVSAATVTRLANIPMAQLDGTIDLDIEYASWLQGELPALDGTLSWQGASVTVAETASLGDVSIVITQQEDSLFADINNDGGDIQLKGKASLNPEADYEADIRLTPAASASRNIRQSLGLFAQPQGDGSYLLNNSGSLKQLGLM